MPYKKLAYQILNIEEGTPVEIIPTHSGALYRLPDRDVELEDGTTMRDFGRFMGYPRCCIMEFTSGDIFAAAEKRSDNYPLTGTGYIPCAKCAAKYGIIKLISRISERRICPTPFPDESGVYSLEFFSFVKANCQSEEAST